MHQYITCKKFKRAFAFSLVGPAAKFENECHSQFREFQHVVKAELVGDVNAAGTRYSQPKSDVHIKNSLVGRMDILV